MNEPKAYLKHRAKLTWLFRFLFKPTYIGSEKIPQTGRVVLAGNHVHFMDCITLASSTSRVVHFLGKSELLEPPLKRYFEPFGVIPVHRGQKDKAALAKAEEYLMDDKVIGIFPEGTINRTEDVIMPFKFGAVKMAHETNTKIVPFIITGAYKPFERSVKIQFKEPITVSDNLEESNNELMSVVADELRKAGK